MSDERPRLIVVAGPNGSGKSTLTNSDLAGDSPVIDPDAIASSINPIDPRDAAMQAGREAIRQQQEYLDRKETFAVETTLSGNRALKLMDDARDQGFNVELHFVRLGNPEANVARVAQRVERGGHDIPRADILRRFDRSMENLPCAIARADTTQLYDNSGYKAFRVASLERDAFTFKDDAPDWATDSAMKGARIQETESTTEAEADRASMRFGEAAVAAGSMTEEQLSDLREKIEDDHNSDRDSGENLKH